MPRIVEYPFEADSSAVTRLERLSEIFAPTMRALVEVLPERDWGMVLDLGCGSGASTRGLRQLLSPARLVGVDASEEHLERARRLNPTGAAFTAGDVEALDLARYDADLIYVRFLLAYLSDVPRELDRWRRQLAPGGVLAIEESLGNESAEPAFQEYFELVDSVVQAEGTCFFGGRKLDALATDGDVLLLRDHRHSVPAKVAAEMFLGNLPLWEAKPCVQKGWGERLPGLRARLEAITSHGDASPVVWTIRQVLMEATRIG